LAREAIFLPTEILPVTEKDLSLALELLEPHPQIDPRDAFHAATMINKAGKQIISTDSHFDVLSQIKRIDPREYRQK